MTQNLTQCVISHTVCNSTLSYGELFVSFFSTLTLIPTKVGGYKPTPADRRSPLGWHRFLEVVHRHRHRHSHRRNHDHQACKFAYARRTLMGDWKHAESEGLEDEVMIIDSLMLVIIMMVLIS